jgi:hypothetical protein
MFRSQTTLTVNFSRYRTWWEALLVELLVSVRSNLGRKRAFKSLSHDLFSENIPYIQLNAKLKDMASYFSLLLRGNCTIVASTDEKQSTECTHCNIAYQGGALITTMLPIKILRISM